MRSAILIQTHSVLIYAEILEVQQSPCKDKFLALQVPASNDQSQTHNQLTKVCLEATVRSVVITPLQSGSTRCISAASIQSLLSPIAACSKLHPPTASVDRVVLWLLSLFGLSNQGEKSSCYIHAAVPTALCPYVSPSVCLSVCLPSSDLVLLIQWQNKNG